MSEVGLAKEQLDTPCLWVDLDTLENNIETLAKHFKSAGINWRPHTKGIKIPAIAHKAIQAGAIGITCAKLSEAEVMVNAGITDILIANQVVGSQKIERLAAINRRADVKVAVDSVANISELSCIASKRGVEIGILVDVDTGMHRTGVQPGEPVVELAREVVDAPGLNFLGVMAWEGHTLTQADVEAKDQAIIECVNLLTTSAELCDASGLPVSIVSGGGSGTYMTMPFQPGVTEIQAGGAMFNDVLNTQWGVQTTQCLFVRTLVTSRPAPDRIIFDAGFKALPAWFFQPKPIGIDNIASYAASAEHGIMKLSEPNMTVAVGDTVDFVVGYTDATLFLHDRLYGIRQGIVEVVWDIVGRGKIN